MGGEGGDGGRGGRGETSHPIFTLGESFPYVGWGGGGLPFFLETFIFIGVVLLNRDFILRRQLR